MYPLGYLEVAHVQYYDADLKSFPVVNTDQGYGHHWPSCKKGNPEDIAALLAVRGPPKKKRKTTKASTEESIVLFDGEAPASSMTFPPSQSVQPTTKKKIRKGTLDSGDSIR
ncbi:hypothetical protein PAHAL_9G417300 [Panicum hallii]|uniref:Uncharacterized protein n=1 Tax=Panicum hallii TaxID=206008 RepID=A0A2T8I4B4_9POAL|nr:uncharacterized protein LOC112873671 [Panicum hallii]PVH32515.1 hypothetical protein PAHAL_9G417300 [Panicum hallii]